MSIVVYVPVIIVAHPRSDQPIFSTDLPQIGTQPIFLNNFKFVFRKTI